MTLNFFRFLKFDYFRESLRFTSRVLHHGLPIVTLYG